MNKSTVNAVVLAGDSGSGLWPLSRQQLPGQFSAQDGKATLLQITINRLGISLGKVNFCLNALVGKGFLKVGNFRNSNNKLAYAYLLTLHGVEQKARMTVEFLQMKMQEYERLRTEIAELKREAEQTISKS